MNKKRLLDIITSQAFFDFYQNDLEDFVTGESDDKEKILKTLDALFPSEPKYALAYGGDGSQTFLEVDDDTEDAVFEKMKEGTVEHLHLIEGALLKSWANPSSSPEE